MRNLLKFNIVILPVYTIPFFFGWGFFQGVAMGALAWLAYEYL